LVRHGKLAATTRTAARGASAAAPALHLVAPVVAVLSLDPADPAALARYVAAAARISGWTAFSSRRRDPATVLCGVAGRVDAARCRRSRVSPLPTVRVRRAVAARARPKAKRRTKWAQA
jgi:predicted ATP-grasp superfamily ATP-dependent carboligase